MCPNHLRPASCRKHLSTFGPSDVLTPPLPCVLISLREKIDILILLPLHVCSSECHSDAALTLACCTFSSTLADALLSHVTADTAPFRAATVHCFASYPHTMLLWTVDPPPECLKPSTFFISSPPAKNLTTPLWSLSFTHLFHHLTTANLYFIFNTFI